MLVGLQTAIETIKLRILRVCTSVDRSRCRVTLTVYAQGILFGVRQDLGPLTFGLSADANARTLPFSTQSRRDFREILLHALVDTRTDLIGQADALHTHGDQFGAEPTDILARIAKHLTRHRGALRRHDLLETALCDDALDAVLHDLGQPSAGDILAAAGGLKVLTGVLHPPFDIKIDDEAAVVIGQEGLTGIRLRDEAAIELDDLVPRPFAMQARDVVDPHDRSKLRPDRQLRLTHREQRGGGNEQQHAKSNDHRESARRHQRSPRPRASTVTVSCSLGIPLLLDSAGCSVSREELFSSSLSKGR